MQRVKLDKGDTDILTLASASEINFLCMHSFKKPEFWWEFGSAAQNQVFTYALIHKIIRRSENLAVLRKHYSLDFTDITY